jgi:hypothetical protein
VNGGTYNIDMTAEDFFGFKSEFIGSST